MDREKLIQDLESKLKVLRDPTMKTVELCVDNVPDWLPVEDIIEQREEGWSWGHCRSETCGHNSHDPYTVGPSLLLQGKELGLDSANRMIIQLASGMIVYHAYRSHGQHFCPSRTLLRA